MLNQLISSFFTFLGVSLICFLLFQVAAGDPASHLSGKYANQGNIDSMRVELGLDKSLIHQYLHFLQDIVLLDWGESWQTREPVSSMLLNGLGPSLSLTLPGFLLSLLVSLAVALVAISRHRSVVDRSIVISCLGLMSISFLVYIIFFQYLLAYKIGWFPVSGWPSEWQDRLQYLALPWLIALVVSIGPNILLYRTILISIARENFVVTARSKGVGAFRLYGLHILNNALVPISAVVFSQIPFLFTGSLLLETYFAIPGVGSLLVEGIRNSDLPMVKAMTLIGSIIYLLINIVADFFYQRFDPRIKLS